MDSFTSMKEKLEQTGIYSVNTGSNIGVELRAYAEGLDSIFDNLAVMEREMFIDTAETYGITEREKFFVRERETYDLSNRRNTLKAQEQTKGEFTVDAFRNILVGYGLTDFEMTEECVARTLIISIRDALTDEEKSVIEERVKADFPAHLFVDVNYVT